MTATLAKSALSPARQHLVVLMQQINFGRIEDLLILAGDPVFTPPPRVIREIKFAGDPRKQIATQDFNLKLQVVEMFQRLAELGNARIELLEIKHGLPFRMTVEAPGSAPGSSQSPNCSKEALPNQM